MKVPFDFASFSGCQPKRGGQLLLLTILLLAGGCGKSSTQPPSASVSSNLTNASATASIATVPANPQAAAATNSNDEQSTLQTLNRALLGWMIQNHRHPKNFAEFESTANIQIPNPPSGKKYTLNARGLIILVDN